MVDLRSTKKLCHKNNILKGSCQKKKKKKKNLKRQRIDNEKTSDAAYILLLAY